MSPLEVRVMLHYHYSPLPWEGPENKNFIHDVHEKFVMQGMLKYDDSEAKYRITPKGTAYVKLVLDIPVPVTMVNYIDPRTLP